MTESSDVPETPETRRTAAAEAAPSSDPFAPAGIEFRSVSRSLVTVRLLTNALFLVPLLIGAIILGIFVAPMTGWWVWLPTALLVALAVWIVWLVPRQVRAIGYAETHEDLLIRSGIMFRTLVVVPYGRLQYVDVNAGPLDRAFGVAKVQLHTASASTDAVLPGLPPGEAARLRDRLSEAGEAQLAGL